VVYFLAVLGVIFLIYLFFKFFPLSAGIGGLILAGAILFFLFVGLAIIAIPILIIVLIIVGITWIIKSVNRNR